MARSDRRRGNKIFLPKQFHLGNRLFISLSDVRSKSLFGLWLWLRMHCQPSFSILWGQPGDAEEISPLCCDVTDVNDAAFIFFFTALALTAATPASHFFSLPPHSKLPYFFVSKAINFYFSYPRGLHKRKPDWAKQCQIPKWHVPTVNLLHQINYETSNISHWLSIPAAKYTSRRIFSAVSRSRRESKPCSTISDTAHLLLCTNTRPCGISMMGLL